MKRTRFAENAVSGIICLNGAAARRVQVDDILIIIAYALMTPEEANTFTPTMVFPDEHNRLAKQLFRLLAYSVIWVDTQALHTVPVVRPAHG